MTVKGEQGHVICQHSI